MSTDRHEPADTDTVERLAAVGIVVTPAARARARARLAHADARITPAHLEQWRRQIHADSPAAA